ncbi:hypothetical protein OBBRIDRAFT_888277 [Obba rivulosa]|uniref:F-box/LRR-repeat protein 15/At3g58940/PEG3-like LRR domain-containing protein n=1 Tax=Obba rivulosa TaxID=1052685 RepID=A0A8E2AUS0_9APHY|nr:hypothetical protein OBBRIDRAFT_888277 [Obba rivulosa]
MPIHTVARGVKGTGATVDDLPNEMLGLIFSAGTAEFWISDFPQARSWPLPFPLILSHVCRRWRAISVSSPTLWCRILIWGGLKMDSLKCFLERSRNLPLSVDFWFPKRSELCCIREVHLRRLIDAVLQHAARWSSCTATIHWIEASLLWGKLASLVLPQLRSLYVRPASSPMAPIKLEVPLLTHLALMYDPPDLRVDAIPLFGGLRSLHLYSMKMRLHVLQSVFGACPHLQILRLLSVEFEGQAQLDALSLRCLELRKSAKSAHMFSFLHAPALEVLVIDRCTRPYLPSRSDRDTGSLTGFLPALRALHFRLHGESIYLQDIDSIVDFDLLEHIGLPSRELARVLERHGHRDDLWPRLSILSCDLGPEVIPFVRARITIGTPLHVIRTSLESPKHRIPPGKLQWLMEHIAIEPSATPSDFTIERNFKGFGACDPESIWPLSYSIDLDGNARQERATGQEAGRSHEESV